MITSIVYRGGGFTVTTDKGVFELDINQRGDAVFCDGCPTNVRAEIMALGIEDLISKLYGNSTERLPIGNTLWVDVVNGIDSVALRGRIDKPFRTVNAALDAAQSGDVVFLLPGNHDLTEGLVMPNGVAIRGLSLENTRIRMLGVTSDTTLITMGNNNRIEDVYLHLQSAMHVKLIGVKYTGTADASSKLRTIVMFVDNSTAGAGSSDVCGVHTDATGSPNITFSNIRAMTINVKSAGNGMKRGLCITSGAFHVRDLNLNVTDGADVIGAETTDAALLTYGIGYINTSSGVSISQTGGTIELLSTVLLGSANGKSFTARSSSGPLVFADPAAPPHGTNYMRPGTYNSSTAEIQQRIPRHCIMKALCVRCRVSPGAGKTDVVTVRKNGVDTTLVVSLSDSDTHADDFTHSAEFDEGDDISIKLEKQNGSTIEDLVVTVEMY